MKFPIKGFFSKYDKFYFLCSANAMQTDKNRDFDRQSINQTFEYFWHFEYFSINATDIYSWEIFGCLKLKT